MTSPGGWNTGQDDYGGQQREPGARRRKLAGYLKAANEIRQTYQQNYFQSWGGKDNFDDTDSMPGAFRDARSAAGSTLGSEEMIIFPSYARRHIRRKPSAFPGTIQEQSGSGRDVRDSTGAGDAEFWKQQWDQYEEDNAIVDVDVRGWIYTPHKGPLTRKNRLFIGLARQMVGIPAPQSSPGQSTPGSRSTSPHGMRQRIEAHNAKQDEEFVAKEAENLLRTGEAEADAADKGIYSEMPGEDDDCQSDQLTPSTRSESGITALQKRSSWTAPAQMSAQALVTANMHLMNRLKPFLANPLATTPISAFFYNEELSRQKTIDTDANGHFHIKAALDFVPTHVRVLASEGLSATVEIMITEPTGVSVISDIDDTIKHSAIGSGAREIFRNVFIRDLNDLNIEGVKGWYRKLADMDVQFHYVSNSPWQLFPVLTKFFEYAGLPQGSFHLKAYSGMFQGIFEPVAERKKGTLEKILRDFPERRFILVGDSGEADLEVYTDLVCENPGRVLGIFIRDVTSPVDKKGFFESSIGNTGPRKLQKSNPNSPRINAMKKQTEEDRDLRLGIAASLKDFESRQDSGEESKPRILPRRQTEPAPPEEYLIDLDSDSEVSKPSKEDPISPLKLLGLGPPARPAKPRSLSSASVASSNGTGNQHQKRSAPPVPPKKPYMAPSDQSSEPSSDPEKQPIPRKQPPPPPVKNISYRTAARQRLNDVYERLPSPASYLRRSAPTSPSLEAQSHPLDNNSRDEAAPALPARRPKGPEPSSTTSSSTSYAASVTNYASSLYNSATAHTETDKYALPDLPPPRRSNTTPNNGAAPPGWYNIASAPAVSKKVELWKRRWARAQASLADDGVVLRSWRVGGDIEGDCVALVEKALEDLEAERVRKSGGVKRTPKG